MKCRSVACIWSGSPPAHRVTAAAVLNQPATLYTGGSDGSIIWWNLSSNDSNQEIKPVAMLCGHAAPIVDLSICFPCVVTRDGKVDNSSNVGLNSKPHDYGAVISACTDGVLCVWSRGSGHCRCRRKIPPWVGSPSMVRALPKNPRYLCIACCFVDSVNLSDNQSPHPIEGAEAPLGRDSQCRKPCKCTIVIVDSYTLAIVQTVFHGNLCIGPLKSMVVVLSAENAEKQLVLMVDSLGKQHCISISDDSSRDGENGTFVQKSTSCLEMTDWADGLSEGKFVTFAICAQILVLVYRTNCIFRLLDTGTIIGEISFIDKHSGLEGSSTESQIIGGMFLDSDSVRQTLDTRESQERFIQNFAVWNNRGSATVYRISYLDKIFNFEALYQIPEVPYEVDVRLSVCFIQLKSFLLRIESVCLHFEQPSLWRSHVTIWSLLWQCDNNPKLLQECKMLGEGNLFVDWIESFTSLHTVKGPRHNVDIELVGGDTVINSLQNFIPFQKVNNPQQENEQYVFSQREQIVSSSMVISENHYAPYAVVYGFYSGEIEVVRFDIFYGVSASNNGRMHDAVDSNVSSQFFSGHTGAVLCLAAHQMMGGSEGCSFKQALLSGSMDCTVRIWDLESGHLITVMHQHIASVRQIILPPPWADRPWVDCFLSVGEDSCVVLTSLETLRVERMFPGHPSYPAKVVWDAARGYVACLCQSHSKASDTLDVLYIWDVKTGARERVIRGTASHSMFDHFCSGINIGTLSGSMLSGNTSASSLLLPVIEDANLSQSRLKISEKGVSSSNVSSNITRMTESVASRVHASNQTSVTKQSVFQSNKHPIKCSCPFPGVAALSFDLTSLMSSFLKHELSKVAGDTGKRKNYLIKERGTEMLSPRYATTDMTINDVSDIPETSAVDNDWFQLLERRLLQFSLSFLHLWNVDSELDKLLVTDMKLKRPENFIVASGLQGDRGSLTLTFPSLSATLELWKASSEFCAMRSLTMVSLAQRMIRLSHSCSASSSALAAFYTRNFAEKIPNVKPPLLQLLVSFWQDESEHVRMAARSLFHCAASRAIPLPLCSQKTNGHAKLLSSSSGLGKTEYENSNIEETFTNKLKSQRRPDIQGMPQAEESEILSWLESYEVQDWISCVGGTSQDAMTSHIIVAAALAIWYPSLVKSSLAMLTVHPLMKLVMAMNEKYSSTAAELLAEGMEGTWKACIISEIPRLIGDIFFQIECVSGASANSSQQNPAVHPNILETLVGILLPSLAMADILGFLNVIERQIWSTASDSPVHVVALMALIKVIRGSPRNLAQYLDKVVNFILQTMDPGNSVMRKNCLQSSMTALKEVVRAFPMVALNDTMTRLAVGDAIGEINNASIRVYDMQSGAKIKVLDASGPPGFPSLLGGDSEMVVTTAISALSFSPDGEGLVAFSEHGLMIRWWSLGSVWWEKLTRNLAPVQCTKLIFIPPWEGFSPNSTRSSIMASIIGHEGQANSQENVRDINDVDRLKVLIHNLDLHYQLEWVGERKILLTRHGTELGTFQL